ncbi:glycosyltransferase family 2 protein [Halomonas urumqiensis]|nr:glycosyltransferase family A protein [Halomonas urumqiensis]GHE20564.1 hypothetical protein GCM10017767_10850 [Halomonas urumqiensis]
MSFLTKANQAFRVGSYNEAFLLYSKAIEENPELEKILEYNIRRCSFEEGEGTGYVASEEDGPRKDSVLIQRYQEFKPTRQARVAVFTAITGGYDPLIEPEEVVFEWDYILFTDGSVQSETVYETRSIPFEDEDPVRVARFVKLNPHFLLPEYDYVLWVDGNVFLRKGIHEEVIRHIHNQERAVFRKHPDRDSVYQEIYKCQELKKDDFGLMNDQLRRYQEKNYSQSSVFFETNVILRKTTDPGVINFNEAWWRELRLGSRRDQLSVNYALDSSGLRYSVFDEECDIRSIDNPLYFIFSHNNNKTKADGIVAAKTNIHFDSSRAERPFRYCTENVEPFSLPFKYKAWFLKGRDLGFLEVATEELELHLADLKDSFKLACAYLTLLQLYLINPRVDQKKVLETVDKALSVTKDEKLLHALVFIKREVDPAFVLKETFDSNYNEDFLIQKANAKEEGAFSVKVMNDVLHCYGLSALRLSKSHNKHLFDSIYPAKPLHRFDYIDSPCKVTIIVSCFNVESEVVTCLVSLMGQTWRNLEIICVDDNSEDGTISVIEELAKFDNRIKLYKNEKNQGTYKNRNFALSKACGHFLTVADADDWNHPQKIQYQAEKLISSPQAVANVACWLRAKNDLTFSRRNGLKYRHLNISSLMFKREEVVSALGCWDEVRFAADGEFYKRLKKVFEGRVEELPAVTSLGRFEDGSLTNNNISGYFGFPYGVRKEYLESYEFFHSNSTWEDFNYKKNKPQHPVPEAMLYSDKSIFAVDCLFISDLRDADSAHQAIDFIYRSEKEGLKWGVCHLPSFDGDPRRKVHDSIRSELFKRGRVCHVYGEFVRAKTVLLYQSSLPLLEYKFLPKINCQVLKLIATQESDMASLAVFRECKKANAFWEELVIAKMIKPYSRLLSCEEGDFYTSLQVVDVNDLDSFMYKGSSKITVVMPCIDLELGKKTAEILIKRAGIDCTVIIAYDSLRQGFIKTLNAVAKKTISRYICFVAQDAYPGREWLKIAYDKIYEKKSGLLAFNDGKWHGRIASFGLVERDWVSKFYGNNIVHESYKAHKADNEITLLARLDGRFVYCPESVLLEVDYNKDSGGSNLIDDVNFKERFNGCFEGNFKKDKVEMYRKEYKVK